MERFHGRDAAELAARDFIARFRHHETPADMPSVSIRAVAGDAARDRASIETGAAGDEHLRGLEAGRAGRRKVDGQKVTDKGLTLSPGRTYVIQVGKRKFARVTID